MSARETYAKLHANVAEMYRDASDDNGRLTVENAALRLEVEALRANQVTPAGEDAIERAADVILTEGDMTGRYNDPPGEALYIARALAATGLLVTPADDDPLKPWGGLIDAPFHSWVEFVEQVARPLVVEEDRPAERTRELMRLYRLTNPYFLCTCLVMAANRTVAPADRAVLDAAIEETEAEEGFVASCDGASGDEALYARWIRSIDARKAAVRARREAAAGGGT